MRCQRYRVLNHNPKAGPGHIRAACWKLEVFKQVRPEAASVAADARLMPPSSRASFFYARCADGHAHALVTMHPADGATHLAERLGYCSCDSCGLAQGRSPVAAAPSLLPRALKLRPLAWQVGQQGSQFRLGLVVLHARSCALPAFWSSWGHRFSSPHRATVSHCWCQQSLSMHCKTACLQTQSSCSSRVPCIHPMQQHEFLAPARRAQRK